MSSGSRGPGSVSARGEIARRETRWSRGVNGRGNEACPRGGTAGLELLRAELERYKNREDFVTEILEVAKRSVQTIKAEARAEAKRSEEGEEA